MIYCIPQENYPQKGFFIEELSYNDENNFEWRIARVENGFMVRYFGHEYFKENTFICDISENEMIRIKNTNCIFFQDSSFDTFCQVRDIIKNGCTDDIWNCFESFFTERLRYDKGLLESEIIN